MVLITDEANESGDSVGEALESLAVEPPATLRAHGMYPDDALACDGGTSEALVPTLVEATGGLGELVCTWDFVPFFEGLVEHQEGLARAVSLPDRPLSWSIEVRVDGVATEAWSLSETDVVLLDRAPGSGSVVEVDYLAATACGG